MLANLFFKRVKPVVAAVALAVLCAVGGYAATLQTADCLDLGISFYYVSVEHSGIESCMQQVSLSGGAGYLIEDMVAFSAYFSMEDAQTVLEQVQKDYNSAKILTVDTDEIFVKKASRVNIENMLKGVYAHIQALATLATRLAA